MHGKRRAWLAAVFGSIAAAIGFGAWTGFPVFADAWIPLITRELGAGALAADSADRPIVGWLFRATAAAGFGPAASVLLTLLFWLVFAWQIARLWKALFPERAGLSWLPAMLALAPLVVRTQLMSATTLYPTNLPVMLVLEALLLGLAERSGGFVVIAALVALAGSISEYGLAAAVTSVAAAAVLGRRRVAWVIGAGGIAGALIFRLWADASLRPETSAAAAGPELLAHPLRPVVRAAAGLWYALVGAYGGAAWRVDLDSLSGTSVAAAALGLAAAILAFRALRGAREPNGAVSSARADLALLAATAAGIVPVVLAGRPAAFVQPAIDPIASRFLIPILPFAVCLTVRGVRRLVSDRGLVVAASLLVFVAVDASWREAFDARRLQRRFETLGETLRPLVERSSGITLAVVPDDPPAAFPPVATGRATLGWSREQARRVWIVPEGEANRLVGSRRDCRVPQELHLPKILHTVERSGPLDRVVWVDFGPEGVGGPQPYCVGLPD